MADLLWFSHQLRAPDLSSEWEEGQPLPVFQVNSQTDAVSVSAAVEVFLGTVDFHQARFKSCQVDQLLSLELTHFLKGVCVFITNKFLGLYGYILSDLYLLETDGMLNSILFAPCLIR